MRGLWLYLGFIFAPLDDGTEEKAEWRPKQGDGTFDVKWSGFTRKSPLFPLTRWERNSE